MIETTLLKSRPAALALAALAFFWTARAADAQIDTSAVAAAFSSARDAFASAKLKEKARRPAPSATDDVWQKILDAVKAKGRYVSEAAPLPCYFALEDVRGDAKADHSADYVSVAGFLDDEGRFQPEYVTLVSEAWKIDPRDGNWHIDQWSFRTDLYGAVTAASRATIVETPAMTVLSIKNRNLSAGDPGAKAKFKALIARWAAGERQ